VSQWCLQGTEGVYGVSPNSTDRFACDPANMTEDATLEQSRSVRQIQQGADFISDHVAWILGLAALLFACARVVVAAGGNTETLKSLMQDLNVTALVGATLLPFTSTVLFWCLIFRLLFLIGKKMGKDKEPLSPHITEIILAWGLTLLVIWFTMPLIYLVANIGVVVLIGIMGFLGWVGEKLSNWVKTLFDLAGTIIVALLLISVVVALFKFAGVWLPNERIKVAGQHPVIGYVLSSDANWTKYMDEGKHICIVPSKSVTQREEVNESQDWYRQTLNQLSP
jgi:hypothetical protein